jgi:hypothetical protein
LRGEGVFKSRPFPFLSACTHPLHPACPASPAVTVNLPTLQSTFTLRPQHYAKSDHCPSPPSIASSLFLARRDRATQPSCKRIHPVSQASRQLHCRCQQADMAENVGKAGNSSVQTHTITLGARVGPSRGNPILPAERRVVGLSPLSHSSLPRLGLRRSLPPRRQAGNVSQRGRSITVRLSLYCDLVGGNLAPRLPSHDSNRERTGRGRRRGRDC